MAGTILYQARLVISVFGTRRVVLRRRFDAGAVPRSALHQVE
jgi:hypothetical protein